MAHITDRHGYNQIYKHDPVNQMRSFRRARGILDTLPPDAKVVLDVGCGDGEIAFHLSKLTSARIIGVDSNEDFIASARERKKRHFPNANLDFVIHDVLLPIDFISQADAVVGNGILHHLYNHLDDFLLNINTSLRPGGTIAFWEPNLHNPYVFLCFQLPILRRLIKLDPNERAFGASLITPKLRQAGFFNISVVPMDFLIPNTPGFLVSPLTSIGTLLEKIPGARHLAQSLFITATKKANL